MKDNAQIAYFSMEIAQQSSIAAYARGAKNWPEIN